MLAATLFSVCVHYAYSLILVLILLYFVSNKYRYGIHKYPGPWLAAYTDLWRFFDALGYRSEKTFLALHQKYGDVVRIGPNVLSFADPKVLKTIYGLNKGFTKVRHSFE